MDYQNTVICNGVTTRALQEKALEILKYFQQVCAENGLRYWAGGGTLIGALRHRGFIPWDDDIDIFMPRADYEKLWEIWDKVGTKPYVLCRTDKDHNNHQTDMQLVDSSTTFINRHSVHEDICHGVSIDIMPMEACPKGKLAQMMQVYHAVMFSVFNVQRLPDHQGKALRLATKVLLSLVPGKERRYKVWKKHEKKMAKYDFDRAGTVKETVTNFKALFRPFPRDFFETEKVPFEDTLIAVPVGADAYLRRIFGDYMRWPPEEDRVAKHDIVYMNMNEPYAQYKGVYYCVEEQGK